VDESAIAPKVSFSAVKEGCLDGRAGMERPQVIVCGAETHVCVLQTALDLKRSGKNVFVVADAAGSRTSADRDFALLRLQQNGIDIVSTEMVMFEWLERAGTDEFRSILREFIR
jgi:nicotinamidase-related amidase